MHYYFGYGSNMDKISLKAKGVESGSWERAVLHGWQLVFNIPPLFNHEGSVANVVTSEEAGMSVHGVLHQINDQDIEKLDALEARGIAYHRVELEVITYSGEKKVAYVYVGVAERLDNNRLTDNRYINILIRGAIHTGLDESYVEKLKAVPLRAEHCYAPFVHPSTSNQEFTLETLAKFPQYGGLAGAVFDMSEADSDHQFLSNLYGGKDMTLFFLKRMDSSDGSETMETYTQGQLSDYQKNHLNAYLHEFEEEYRYMGRLIY